MSTMKTFEIAYFSTLVLFLAINAIWLGVIARKFYQQQLADLMLPSPYLAVLQGWAAFRLRRV